MGRTLRAAEGGWVYHVLNRANARRPIFKKSGDYSAFEAILEAGVERYDMRLLAYCLMGNHWHLLLWPKADGDLSRFMGWITLTHAQRWHAHRKSAGSGHLYQGRFKSFPVQEDEHFYTVCRYVERNALRANVVERAEDWQSSSLWRRLHGSLEQRACLSKWPLPEPKLWRRFVNQAESEAELAALRRSVRRGSPFGDAVWTGWTAAALGIESSLTPRGRPRKQPTELK